MDDIQNLAMKIPAKKRKRKLDDYKELIFLLHYGKDYTCVDVAAFLGDTKKMGEIGAKPVEVDQSSVWDLLDGDPDRERRLKEARRRRRRNRYARPAWPARKRDILPVSRQSDSLPEPSPEPPETDAPGLSQSPVRDLPQTRRRPAFSAESLLTNDQVSD